MNIVQHAKILNALTKYDEKQSRRKFYNSYAFGQYCGALQNTQRHCDNGVHIRDALLNCFCGRLLDVVLKSVGMSIATASEHRGDFKKFYLEDE